jgi:hypothetical protein
LEALAFTGTITFAVCNLGDIVACPFFMPEERFDADWPFPHRLPLGAGWNGTCTAAGNVRPSDEELKARCNVGYATGCARLPEERQADAVRFALGEERNGLIHIRFACEREYLPVSHGELIYDATARCWQTTHTNACLLRMAECYVHSQMARRGMHAAASAGKAEVAPLQEN